MSKCKKEQEAIIIIRFGEAVYQTCKNALTKQMSVTKQYGGRVIGIAHACDIKVLQGEWPGDKGLAVLCFPSMTDAKRWEHSTPEIRQNDWLAGVDMIVSPALCPISSCDSVIQLSSFEADSNVQQDFSDFPAKELHELMCEHGVKNLIGTKNTERLRGSWFTHFFVVNLYSSMDKAKAFGETDLVKSMKAKRDSMGYTTSVVLQLGKLC